MGPNGWNRSTARGRPSHGVTCAQNRTDWTHSWIHLLRPGECSATDDDINVTSKYTQLCVLTTIELFYWINRWATRERCQTGIDTLCIEHCIEIVALPPKNYRRSKCGRACKRKSREADINDEVERRMRWKNFPFQPIWKSRERWRPKKLFGACLKTLWKFWNWQWNTPISRGKKLIVLSGKVVVKVHGSNFSVCSIMARYGPLYVSYIGVRAWDRSLHEMTHEIG